ncbi:retrotransposon protein, putative, ty1-copia subclass [Tanacetum coccineum]
MRETYVELQFQAYSPAPAAESVANVLAGWNAIYDAYNEVACLMLGKQAGVERFDLIQTFHACKQEKGKPIAAYVLKMKGYVEQLVSLGYMLPQDLIVGLILKGLTSDFAGFMRNYNMHNMGKTISELHAMLIEYEKGLPKKAETPQVMMIKGGKIQKANKKSLKAKGKGKANGKGKDKQVYIPKPKNPKPSAKEHPAKDDTCHHCKEVGHCKRNCPAYLAELIKKKKQVGTASSSDVFIIELFSFPTKSWVYDTSCGTHICNTKHGLGGVRKLKQVEAIGSFDLVLPNGLVICLDNCHYAPSITRGVVSVHRLVENGFVQCFTDFGISVSKNNVFYFNAIPRDGIYEIDMHNLVPNLNSIYNVSNKRAKNNSDSTYIWHCRLAHISKKCIEKLQHEVILKSTDDESFYQCTDISEVTRKQSKNEQARTRESEEYKKKPKNQSRSQEKSNPQSKWSNHGQQKAPKQDGKEKSVISSDLTSSHSRGDTVTAWQSSSVHNDPTANIQDPMIAMIGWQRLKDWQRLKGPRSFSLSL